MRAALRRRRRPGLRRPDLPPLPARAATSRGSRPSSRRGTADPARARLRGDHLLQPDDLRRLRARLRARPQAAGALTENAGRRALPSTATSSSVVSAVRLLGAAAAGSFYRQLLGEAVGDGYDGWMEDFGEYTPLDSRSADGMRPARDAQPLPARSTTARHRRFAAPAAAAAGALHPLRLDRRRRAARRSSGAATRPPTGASTGCARRSRTRSRSGSRGSASGARTSAASSPSARAA